MPVPLNRLPALVDSNPIAPWLGFQCRATWDLAGGLVRCPLTRRRLADVPVDDQTNAVTRAAWLGSSWHQPASPQCAALQPGVDALRARRQTPRVV